MPPGKKIEKLYFVLFQYAGLRQGAVLLTGVGDS